jgi:hypothetical protein
MSEYINELLFKVIIWVVGTNMYEIRLFPGGLSAGRQASYEIESNFSVYRSCSIDDNSDLKRSVSFPMNLVLRKLTIMRNKVILHMRLVAEI